MPYVTYILKDTMNTETRHTLTEMLMGAAGYTPQHQQYSKNFFKTRTHFVRQANEMNLGLLYSMLDEPYTKEYTQFRIPKASGGTRLIEAPTDDLKVLQASVADILFNRYRVLPHNAAYAYTHGRSAYDSLVTHQANNARWFLKIDVKDFFPSITREVLSEQLPKIYPFCLIPPEYMAKLIELAVNDSGKLPQGSPLSPLLSNMVMVEFDLKLSSKIRDYNKQRYTYTRYADDMLISCPYTFQYSEIVTVIEDLFNKLNLPFVIAKHKLRYASHAGRNWNLGLMFNQEQKITVGTKRKRELHSLVNSFAVEEWDKQSTQELMGKLAYLKNIEPDYFQTIIDKYSIKYNLDILHKFKTILSS